MDYLNNKWVLKLKEKVNQLYQYFKTIDKKKFFRISAIGVAGLITIIILFVISVRIGVFGKIPTQQELLSIENPQASIVYGNDEEILGKYFIQNRTNVPFENISSHIINALISTEDVRYYEHNGIDWRSWGRVFFKTLLLQRKSSGGGSTISQQLAKNLFPRKHYTFCSLPINKTKEIWTARKIEKLFSKEDILTLYLNTVSFGGVTYGIKAASKQIFNIDPTNVSIEDAALLIGMLKATSFYHPAKDLERATKRRNVVLGQMNKANFISLKEQDSLISLPVKIDLIDEDNSAGTATYFREHLRLQVSKILKKINVEKGTEYNLYTDGLKIYTTIDPIIQKATEKSVAKRMKSLQKELNKHWNNKKPWETSSELKKEIAKSVRYRSYKKAGFSKTQIDSLFKVPVQMKIFSFEGDESVNWSPLDSIKYYMGLFQSGSLSSDPKTGAIRSWVGGLNHQYLKYDHVLSKRQTGSIFKPIVYARALQLGYTPCDYLDNELITYVDYDDWTPKNANDTYGGLYSLQGALSHSINTVTVWLAMEGGIDSIRALANRLGISSELPNVPSISLGTGESSLFDMVQVYSTIANFGRYQPLYYLDRIETKSGTIIYNHNPVKPIQVLNPAHASVLKHMMKNTVNSGTATSLKTTFKIPGEIAGKTGTTQRHTDGWFIGITPKLVTGVWVGGDNPLVRFRNLGQGQGAHMALPIWAYLHQEIYKHKKYKAWPRAKFENLSYEWREFMDCEDYIDDYALPWERKEEFTSIDSDEDRASRKRSKKRRKRKSEENKLESFFKKLFKKKN